MGEYMKLATEFKDYQILGMSSGMKIEKWNNIILKRPDPEIIWEDNLPDIKVDAIYNRSKEGGGSWEICNSKIPNIWQIKYRELTFNLKLMGFKHTGLFPEQSVNWDMIMDKINKSNRPVRVLNLFAYTGGASIAALKAGAEVTHVDSSKGMVEWAKENAKASGLENKPIRYFVDDVKKFVKREIRRENKYDIIIMDPPSFGRGTKNEVWNIEKDLFELIKDCTSLLTKNPILFLINSYTTGFSKAVLENILELTVNQKVKGKITSYELGIPMNNSKLILPCGLSALWEEDK